MFIITAAVRIPIMKFRLLVLCGAVLSTMFAQPTYPDEAALARMSARLAPVKLEAPISSLSAEDRRALAKLIDAAKRVDHLFLQQVWSGNLDLEKRLRADHSPVGKARLNYFLQNKGPWSELDAHQVFIPGAPEKKPEGANFYPEGMTKAEFETWSNGLPPAQKEAATGFFTVIRGDAHRQLSIVPYSQEYSADLKAMAKDLRDAAQLTPNESLRHFLTARADAFLSNDYYASDLAWMDLDAPLDVTIGPYETYNDELFGYKAGFEAYVNIRDDAETAKLKFFADHLQAVEDHLPIDPKYRNAKLGAQAPIRVVNEVISTGDAAHGVRTAAYNLPNDDRVIQQKGSKRVMLKNVQEAKFRLILEPIAARVLPASARGDLSFDAFFTHILAHELSHGIGPHQINLNGRSSSVRLELKDTYSALEEAKADITGLFMLGYLFESGELKNAPADFEQKLYTSFLASAFRSLRFGLTEAHGKGMALQVNYLLDAGAFVHRPDGTFSVDLPKIKEGVKSLTGKLMTIEAEGDYAGAKQMLQTMAVVRPEVQTALDGLKALPIDIAPQE